MIRIGPAGWSYKDWNGIVYPKPKPRGFDPLRYLARYFDAIEINSTYYGPPSASATRKWVASIAENSTFRFTAKLLHSFTHERNPASNDEKEFKEGIAPIAEANRLGALLFQFPWSFKNSPENRQYIAGLQRRFREFPLVLEVRHASWNDPGILDFLSELEIGLCNIDQPLFKRSITPGADVTSAVGYVRLHGRNYKNWFSEKADVRERYDYLYPARELAPWVDRIAEIERRAKETYVMSNNHNLGKATINALQIMALLRGNIVDAPESLIEHYPDDLHGFAQVVKTPVLFSPQDCK